MRHAVNYAAGLAALVVGCAPARERVASSTSNTDSAAASRATPAVQSRDTLWLLARRSVDDAVHRSDSEADLIQRYGALNVRRDTIALGEGESAPGTTLFASDSLRRVEILWRDTIGFGHPYSVEIRGAASRWIVAPGVSLGTTLAELERLNARPFLLFGFGWDYSGTINSWEGGRLDSLWQDPADRERLVGVRVGPTASAPESIAGAVQGERLFSSSHASMAALEPKVYDLSVRPR